MSTWAAAESLPKETILPLRLAQKAAASAMTKCEEGGYHVSVAVVDHGGNIRALLRGDGADRRGRTTDLAYRHLSARVDYDDQDASRI